MNTSEEWSENEDWMEQTQSYVEIRGSWNDYQTPGSSDYEDPKDGQVKEPRDRPIHLKPILTDTDSNRFWDF